MPKRWIFPPDALAPPDLEPWARRLSVSGFLAELLWRRGVADLEDMESFLDPGLRRLPQPEALPGLMDAAQVLAQGLAQGKKLAVWGDYDVDGVTATAVVLDFLSWRGITAVSHIPHRTRDGYGVNVAGVEALARSGVQMLLTVDCGITDLAPMARAKELGLDVVVTDHHLAGTDLPQAAAICNPRLATCQAPGLADMAGVGVAFYLAAALNRLLPGGPLDVRPLLDLVALGTLADVVDLTGVNRILVKNGLLLLNQATRPGIAALKEAAGFTPGAELTAGQVVFGLAPRINAAGRLDLASQALDMLLEPDVHAARPLAKRLDTLNRERRGVEGAILDQAREQAETQLERRGLVLAAPDWHSGVVGIVASRVVEAFYRPTLILGQSDGLLRGSGRRIPECDIHACLVACEDLLLEYGGHHQAGGLTLKAENLEMLRERFDAAVAAQAGPEPLTPSLAVDSVLGFEYVDFTLLKELELLHPFGAANPEPVFASRPLTVRSMRAFGKDRAHARLELRDEQAGVTLTGKAWRMAKSLPKDIQGQALQVAFSPTIDRYDGLARVDLTIRDWRPAPPGKT